jgi:hypothetical protein
MVTTEPRITLEQIAILDHTECRASVRGHYCGDSPAMQGLVALGLMESAGRVSFVPDEYFRLTPAGHALIRRVNRTKVFEVCEADCVAAESWDQAVAFYLQVTDCLREEIYQDPRQKSAADMRTERRIDCDDPPDADGELPSRPLLESLASDLLNPRVQVPYLFSTTEW